MKTKIVVFEDFGWQRFLPLVYIRAIFELVVGMDSLLAKVLRLPSLEGKTAAIGVWCRTGIAEAVAERTDVVVNQASPEPTLLLNGRVRWTRLPDVDDLDTAWVGLGPGKQLACIYATPELMQQLRPSVLLDEARMRAILAKVPRRDISHCIDSMFDWPWELVNSNEQCLIDDWDWFSTHRTHRRASLSQADDGEGHAQLKPQGVMVGSHLINTRYIHIGHGTRIKPCVVVDAEEGPVWIGDHVTIQPHCYIQGPAFIGDGTILQPGTSIREATTVGRVCKLGGEIESSIIHSYSNKQHDGFLGHSYIGSWVNIAADCINSDLKNTYGSIRVPINGREIDTGHMFSGMFMGDYSKAGINVSFPTGSVIGFCSSVFAPRSPKFVSSFCWVDGEKIERYDVRRGLLLAKKVMMRRSIVMTEAEEAAFRAVREQALAIEHYHQQILEFTTNSLTHRPGSRVERSRDWHSNLPR